MGTLTMQQKSKFFYWSMAVLTVVVAGLWLSDRRDSDYSYATEGVWSLRFLLGIGAIVAFSWWKDSNYKPGQ